MTVKLISDENTGIFNNLIPGEDLSSSVKLAVFDCDGTLVDSQHAINSCMSDAFRQVGLVPPPISRVRRVVGLPLAEAIQILVSNDNGPDAQNLPPRIGDMVDAYSLSWQRLRKGGALDEPLFDGTAALLASLKSIEWTLGVATGKSMRGLRQTLDHHELGGFFSTLQTADVARGKPDPEMLHLAMLETQSEPVDTVMIGDTTYDMEMACAAGVRALGVAWGYHSPEDLMKAGAIRVFESWAELETYLKNMEDIAS